MQDPAAQAAGVTRQERMTPEQETEEIELDLLLEALWRRHGLDLREHARSSLRRRLSGFMHEEKLATLSDLQSRVLRDTAVLERLSHRISVSVTSMFRDPGFYRHLRDDAVPLLRTWPSIGVWIAGCATGEEVYSLNIVMLEAGLIDRVRIHATDRSRALLAAARSATYPLPVMREYTANYIAAGGKAEFSNYYKAGHENATLREELRRNVTFSVHDLAVDGRFNEFQLVLCRNVLIYFQDTLKQRVLELIHASLVPFGILALGTKESLRFLPASTSYEELSAEWRTYRKHG